MTIRRMSVRVLTAAVVAFGVMIVPAVAAELMGVLSKVDVEGKKVTVIEKGTDKEVEVTVTDDTEWVTPKGESKIDLTKVEKQVTKAIEKGRKGIPVTVTHEDAVASKIEVKYGAPKKKAAN